MCVCVCVYACVCVHVCECVRVYECARIGGGGNIEKMKGVKYCMEKLSSKSSDDSAQRKGESIRKNRRTRICGFQGCPSQIKKRKK